MEKLNIDCNNITIRGNIYCKGDVILTPNAVIDESYNVIKYDFGITGDLWIFCNHLYILNGGLGARIFDHDMSIKYNKTDFKVIKADKIYIRCPNLKIGKDVWAYYDDFDQLRNLKLNKIYERIQMSSIL